MQQTLGIDINDQQLHGVVVTGKGKDCAVVSAASVSLRDPESFLQDLPALLEQLPWQGGDCVLGLPLSVLSLRNLNLPFTGSKKIEQVLPFELEEHLLVPVADQIIAPVTVEEHGDNSHLLVAALEKKLIASALDTLQTVGLDPDIICPSCYALALVLTEVQEKKDSFLVLYGDICSMSLVLVHQGIVTFMRRLAYPEQVFTEEIFVQQGREIQVREQIAADAAMRDCCGMVTRSLEYYSFLSPGSVAPDRVILAGPMQQVDNLATIIEQELSLPVLSCNLARSYSIKQTDPGKWHPTTYDSSLALALLGNRKRTGLNFRRDEFASHSVFSGSRRQVITIVAIVALAACLFLGYAFFDTLRLQKQHDTLSSEMKKIFQQSFPAVTRIVDPLLQMRTRIKVLEAPKVAMPLFTEKPRVLVLLADISSRIPAGMSLHVSRLVVDQDSVRIKGTTDAFNNVNTMKTVLDKSLLFSSVSIVSASKTKDKGIIRFELRMQLGGKS